MASTPSSTTLPPAATPFTITQQFEFVIAEFSNLGAVLQAAIDEAPSNSLRSQQLIGAAQYMVANLGDAFAALVTAGYAADRAVGR